MEAKRKQHQGKGIGGRTVAQAVLLMAIWIMLSGRLDAFHLITGALAVFFVMWLDRKLGPATLGDVEVALRLDLVRFFLYIPWLGWQMLLSSWQVALAIVDPGRHLNPHLVLFRSRQPHIMAKVFLGNSITLTPGTLTLDITGDRYLVHSLSDASTEGLFSGTMQRKVARLFGSDARDAVFEPQVLQGSFRL
jgi:multicomponent Na+:H+ antiporter subunit E